MKYVKFFSIFFCIGITFLFFSCVNPKKEQNKQMSNQVELKKQKKDLAPLTCDSIYFNKDKQFISILLVNNSEYAIALRDFDKFQYKYKSAWKEVPLSHEITGFIGGNPVILKGGNYIRGIFINDYVMDSVTNYLRIIQPYSMRNSAENHSDDSLRYLYQEFTLHQLGITNR